MVFTIVSCLILDKNNYVNLQHGINKKFANQKIENIYSQIESGSEVFEIDSALDTSFITKSGLTVTIPANSFMKCDESKIKEKVFFEIIDLSDYNDLLKRELHNQTNNYESKFLRCIYINSYDNTGSEIELNLYSNVKISIPTSDSFQRYSRYYGLYNASQRIKWIEHDNIFYQDSFLLLPLDSLKMSYHKKIRNVLGGGLEQVDKYTITDPKYQSSWIASPNFRTRFNLMNNFIGHKIGGYRDDLKDRIDSIYSIDVHPAEIYLAHYDKPLSYADSMVNEFFIVEEKKIQEHIKASKPWIKPRSNFLRNPTFYPLNDSHIKMPSYRYDYYKCLSSLKEIDSLTHEELFNYVSRNILKKNYLIGMKQRKKRIVSGHGYSLDISPSCFGWTLINLDDNSSDLGLDEVEISISSNRDDVFKMFLVNKSMNSCIELQKNSDSNNIFSISNLQKKSDLLEDEHVIYSVIKNEGKLDYYTNTINLTLSTDVEITIDKR